MNMNATTTLLIRVSNIIHCQCSRQMSRLKLNPDQIRFLKPFNFITEHTRFNCSQFSSIAENNERRTWCESSDKDTENVIAEDFKLIRKFIREDEENCLLKEVESYLKRMRYEYDHWDNAIHGYRETEKSRWNDDNQAILQRVRDAAFEPGMPQLTLVHVLDLAPDGYIKPHVDSIKFCGSTITGLSLLSPAIMKLVNEKNAKQWVNILLEPRSLYIMKGQSRYDYTHEILKQEEAVFHGKAIPKDRRISIMCRNEPTSGKA